MLTDLRNKSLRGASTLEDARVLISRNHPIEPNALQLLVAAAASPGYAPTTNPVDAKIDRFLTNVYGTGAWKAQQPPPDLLTPNEARAVEEAERAVAAAASDRDLALEALSAARAVAERQPYNESAQARSRAAELAFTEQDRRLQQSRAALTLVHRNAQARRRAQLAAASGVQKPVRARR